MEYDSGTAKMEGSFTSKRGGEIFLIFIVVQKSFKAFFKIRFEPMQVFYVPMSLKIKDNLDNWAKKCQRVFQSRC